METLILKASRIRIPMKKKNSSAGFGIGIDLSGQNKKDSQDNLDKKTRLTMPTRQVSLVVPARATLTANTKA